MKQRIVIAMALLLRPKVLVLDEPTTALDVIVQKDILVKVRDLQDQLNFSMIFISHDLPLLLSYCDRIAIMLNGEIIEQGPCFRVKSQPKEDYTIKLLHAFPSL